MGSFDNKSAGERWRFRRNLVLWIAHKNGVSKRLLADVFDLPRSRVETIIRNWQAGEYRVPSPDFARNDEPETPIAIEGQPWHDRLVFDFDISNDSPVIKGTWVTVATIVSHVVDGYTWSDILRCHPELTESDIHAALAYSLDQQENPAQEAPR